MFFFNFTDEAFYAVEINRFVVRRSTQRQHLYQYSFDMTALRDLQKPSDAGKDFLSAFLSSPPAIDQDFGPWETLLEAYTSVSTVVANVINYTRDLRGKLQTVRQAVASFRQGLSDVIEAPFGLVSDALKTVDFILDAVVSLERLPHEFTDALRRTKRDLLLLKSRPDLFGPSSTNLDEDPVSADDVLEVVTASLPNSYIVENVGAVPLHDPENTLFDDEQSVSEVAASEDPVRDGDSIETIAERTLGDASQWKRLADLNGLEYPFVGQAGLDKFSEVLGEGQCYTDMPSGTRTVYCSDFTPEPGDVVALSEGSLVDGGVVEEVVAGQFGQEIKLESPLEKDFSRNASATRHERALSVLLPGEKVLVPGSADRTAMLDSDGTFEQRAYGIDEFLDANGRHASDGSGRVMAVGGIENLVMQLEHRLATVRGELAQLGHPRYGSLIPTFIGRAGTPMWYERIRVEARSVMLEDPRVDRVASLDLRVDGTRLTVEADVVPVGHASPRRVNLLIG